MLLSPKWMGHAPRVARERDELMTSASSIAISILDVLVLIELPIGSLDGVWESPEA
jgi:hypothetical protein